MKLLSERYPVSEGDVARHTIRYTGRLERGENLTGTPSFTDASGDLVFSNAKINSVPLEVLGKRTPAGQSLSFVTSGQLAANGPYRFGVTVDTTGGQTIGLDIEMPVAT